MPLNEDAINDILPFAPDGTEAAGDLVTVEAYRVHVQRLRGHQPGLASRALENRVLRQLSLMAAGTGQYIANRHAPGVSADPTIDEVEEGLVAAVAAQIAAALGAYTPDLTGYLRRTVNTPNLAAGYYVTPLAMAIAAGVVTPDFAARNVQTLAVTGSITLAAPATIPAGGGARIIATIDATGNRALTLASTYRVIDGEWDSTAGAVSILDFVFGGPNGLIDVQISQRGTV